VSIKLTALACAGFSLIAIGPVAAQPAPSGSQAPAAAAPGPPRPASDPAADREAIKARLSDWVGGMVVRDPTALDKLLARDFQAVTYTGRLLDRASSPDAEIKAVTTKTVDVRLYGDAAVVRALLSVIERRDGRIVTTPIRITQTWVREGGEWRAVADQATRVEPSPPTPPAEPAAPAAAAPGSTAAPITVGAATPNG
jgi:ketosteroid isomerase-like protein